MTMAQQSVRIGTLVPKSSAVGQILLDWALAVSKKSEGKLELQIFYNAQQGDEGAMVGKMKAGMLEGAVISAVGLGKTYKPIPAIEMPGLFTNSSAFNKAFEVMRPEFEKGIQDAGFTNLGLYRSGMVRFMSKGVTIKSPADLKNGKPYLWRDDKNNMPAFYAAIDGVVPVVFNVPEVLPNLNTGEINILYSTSLLAEKQGWAAKLDNINDDLEWMSISGVVISSKFVNTLSDDLKNILISTGKAAADSLDRKIPDEDLTAYERIKSKMSVVKRSADDLSKWVSHYKAVRQRLSQGTFSPELVSKLERLAGKR